MKHFLSTRTRHLCLILLGALILAACTDIGPIGDPTVIPVTPDTATPGGVISMMLPTDPPPMVTPPSVPATIPAVPVAVGSDLDSPADCPSPGNPAPPSVPPSYAQYITTINGFLSEGGAVPFLASILQTWGAVGDGFGGVTDSYDLTGDGVYEVVVTISDPLNATVAPYPGQLLIFGCHQDNYRLLYSSDYGPGFGVPEILHVGDMNGDAQPEFVFFQERCQIASCVQAAQILTWSAPNDGFLALNVDTVGSVGGQFSIQELDDDGVLEIMIRGVGAPTDISAGPPRGATTVWDWNGLNYVRAVTQLDPPIYRIHVIHDGDLALENGDGQEAISLYRQALDNRQLGTWHVPNEAAMIRAYAHYRLILAYSYVESSEAQNVRNALLTENPQGTPGNVYAAMGDAFWNALQASNNLHNGCLAAVQVVAARPDALIFLNSYGSANRIYQAPDLCPF